jgi:hypothetical protein
MREFPGFEKFFRLWMSASSRPFQGYVKPMSGHIGAGPDTDFALTRGEWRPDHPVAVGHDGGGAPQDLVWAGPICVLVNRRVVDLLQEHQFTGWGTYAVDLRGKHGEPIEGYVGLAVHGRCGPVDKSRAKAAWRQYPKGMFLERQGFYFDPESWDGSDFFMTTGEHGAKLVTDAVRAAFTKAKIRNATFSPLLEYWWGE